MSNELETINRLIQDGKTDDAIGLLNGCIDAGESSDKIFFLLGKAYNKLGNLRQAIYNYNVAVEKNPDSPAKEALEQIQEILAFYNTDLYNP